MIQPYDEAKEFTMATETSVTLGEHFETFINSKVNGGQYGSASEVIRAGLRLLEEHEAKVALIRKSLVEGEQSGRADYSLDAVKQALDHA